MNLSDLIVKIPVELVTEANIVLLHRNDAVEVLPLNYKTRPDDFVFRYGNTNGTLTFEPIPLAEFPPESVNPEAWLAEQGFSSMRVITLLDLEGKLAAAGKSSAKLSAVRAWINGILATYAANPAPQSNWPEAPFEFEETLSEAFAALV
jgi:hypothetical protein